MKVFISYRFSDIKKEDLEKLLDPVCLFVKDSGLNIFCNFYKDQYYLDNKYSAKEIMEDCFINIDDSDIILCLVDTQKYSCGMLLEIGYSLANKKNIIVCSRVDCEIDTLCQMANHNIKYSNYNELLEEIRNVFSSSQFNLMKNF